MPSGSCLSLIQMYNPSILQPGVWVILDNHRGKVYPQEGDVANSHKP